jgi:hypothetical protein
MKNVEIRVVLTDEQAWEFAQFLKRVCFSDCERRATSEAEAYLMLEAGELIRQALAEQGYAPR